MTKMNLKKHSFNRVSDVKNQLNNYNVGNNNSNDVSLQLNTYSLHNNLPDHFRSRVKGNSHEAQPKSEQDQISLRMMKSKGNVQGDLSDILAVKAEQIRHRLLTELKDKDEDFHDPEEYEELAKHIGTNDNHPGQQMIKHGRALAQADLEPLSRIPLSKARMKRRQMIKEKSSHLTNMDKGSHFISKVKSNKSTIRIQNYRPGYSWNRGGRVKELRIRCLARKYLFIWRKNVFGRIPLSVAQHHYEMSLKRQGFDIWYDFWWEIVKEWRLGVRAECHFRYKLGCRMFQAWKEYIISRRIKNGVNKMAVTHYKHTQTSKLWACWQRYIKEKNDRKVLLHRAEEFHGLKTTRNAWEVWKFSFATAEERREKEATALQFWSYRLQAEHWLIWKAALMERSHVKEQLDNVSMYYNSVLATRCLKAWRLYTANRQTKKAHAAFACRMYKNQLKINCFRHWSQHWHLACSIRRHHHQIEELAKTFRQRWAIARWNQYVGLCKKMKEKESTAVEHYNQHLMHFGLASFRLNVVYSHIKEMRMKLSLQLEATQLQRRFWNHWVNMYDQREEERMVTFTSIAHQCYNSNLMLKCFSALVDYTQWRKLRKVQHAQADAHFYLHAVPKCLFHMKIFIQLERTCQDNALAAKCFYRANVQRRVFIKWKSDAQSIKDQRMMFRMAVLHHESILTKSLFAVWKYRTEEMEIEKQKIEEAHRHYLYNLCHKALGAWRGVVLLNQKRGMDFVRALQYHTKTTEMKCIKSWKQWMKEKKEAKLKKELASKHNSRHVYTVCVKEWKAMWTQGKRFKVYAEELLSQYNENVLRCALTEWKFVTGKLVVKRKQKVMASVHLNCCLMLKVIQEWHGWAAVQAYKRSQTKKLLEQAVSQLQQLKLASYFKKWQTEMDTANLDHLKQDKADRHYRHILQTKSLTCWKDHARLCLRKSLLHGQRCRFNEVRLTAKHFFTWKAQWTERIEENSKTEIALWQWSLMLERKVLFAWKDFKDHQKHKKCRIMDAALFRRQRLLQVACCHWLTTADSLSQVRASTAAHYQTKAVMDSFRLVQKCALHWKSWALRRIAGKDKIEKSEKASFFSASTKLRLQPNVIEFQNIPASGFDKRGPFETGYVQPQLTLASPIRLISSDGHPSRQRPLPTRPSFLMESLQRAGLSEYMFSGPPEKEMETLESDSQSTLSESDNQHTLPSSPERPTTGRFSTHVQSPSQLRRIRDITYTQEHPDSSFSAEVLSGSTSTLGPSSLEVKSLHLDAAHSSSHTTSSLSPQLFTPSTQRSQFSGNPLLNSSPLSDTGHSRPITTRTEEGHGLLDSDSDGGKMVSGNLGNDSQGLQKLQFWEQQQLQKQQQDQQIDDFLEKDQNTRKDKEKIVLLKPEYFMQKPPAKIDKAERKKGGEELVRFEVKNTPRSFATWDTSSEGVDGVLSDLSRGGKGMLRHTPRELTSPRRAPPQGILHNRASDSDVDVSPLNTARSRGTVTFASPKSPTPDEEIVNIRDRLRHFSDQKRKLRSLQKKYQLLSDWIEEQGTHQVSEEQIGEEEDSHSRSATEELDLVRLEVAQLKTIVDGQQPICEKLVQRAQVLAAQLNLPF